MKVAGRILYWLMVVLVSLALVIAILLFVESRDRSQVREGAGRAAPARVERAEGGSTRSKRAKTTIRWAALYKG